MNRYREITVNSNLFANITLNRIEKLRKEYGMNFVCCDGKVDKVILDWRVENE